MTIRIVIGHPWFSAEHEWQDLVQYFPPEVEVSIHALPPGELAPALAGGIAADVVVPGMAAVTAAAIRRGHFGLIQQFGAGTERIDVDAATEAGVWVANMPGLNAIPVAEHAIALLLALYRRLPEAPRGFLAGHWGEPTPRSLDGAVVCVVGLGAVGGEVAARLRAFGVHVIGVRRTPRPGDAPDVVDTGQLMNVIGDADCVVVTASHHPGAAAIVDAQVIARMKPQAILVNVARGALIDNDAALRAVESGRLSLDPPMG